MPYPSTVSVFSWSLRMSSQVTGVAMLAALRPRAEAQATAAVRVLRRIGSRGRAIGVVLVMVGFPCRGERRVGRLPTIGLHSSARPASCFRHSGPGLPTDLALRPRKEAMPTKAPFLDIRPLPSLRRVIPPFL